MNSLTEKWDDDSWEEVASGIYRLGGWIDLDGRVSWAPEIPGHKQPINCYVINTSDGVMLVDTGIALHREQVLTGLRSLVRDGVQVTQFLTRTEFECVGNVRAIQQGIGIAQIVAGGRQNPFDAYDEVSKSAEVSIERKILPSAGSDPVSFGPDGHMVMLPARIRILTTYWLYDGSSKTLFTSDFFGHTSSPAHKQQAIRRTSEEEDENFESVKNHILEKFSWLALADTTPLQNWLKELFSTYDVKTIAPTHGCILSGRDVVQRHVALVLEVLSAVSVENEHNDRSGDAG